LVSGAAAAGAGVAAAGAATTGVPGTAGAVTAGVAPAAAGALLGSSAKAAAATVSVKVAAIMIFLKVMSYPPFLKMKFVNKFFGHSVKIFVGYVSIVKRQCPGNKKLGESKYIAEVYNTNHLDLEQTWRVCCSDREQEVIRAGKNPPAEKECCLFVGEFEKLRILRDCCPIILFFCHLLLLSCFCKKFDYNPDLTSPFNLFNSV
jgi:hypothetical protein